jgi:transaldolase/glucose-6-phosphate isomerase
MRRIIFSLQDYQERVMGRLLRWKEEDYIRRLRERDAALWFSEPQPEITDRLGWLFLPDLMKHKVEKIHAFRDEVKADRFSHAVLCGMGGSSLAAEVFQDVFGHRAGFPELYVLDSTHPDAVHSLTRKIDLEKTLFVVSSKSGTTLETLSLFRYFWQKINQMSSTPGRHFVAITDPGTPLESLARERKFRITFLAPPDVGGRYSALSDFGLVPAALIGLDVGELIEKAKFASESCSEDVSEERLSCLFLGAACGEVGRIRDKLTFYTSSSIHRFGDWVEQLLAESTGKDGKGIVPVIDEMLLPVEMYGDDRFFVALLLEGDETEELRRHLERVQENGHPCIRIDLKEKLGLIQEFFRWEVAVASAGSVMGIHPFNQPDVQLSKQFTRAAMEEGSPEEQGDRTELFPIMGKNSKQAFSAWLSKGKTSDYVCIQAFLPPTPTISESLMSLKTKLTEKTRLAGTSGYGPRFLHSTGQLHKGGANNGLYLQLVDEPELDLPVPETDFTFNSLIQAQALGDYLALKQKNRRVIRINLGEDVPAGIKELEDWI